MRRLSENSLTVKLLNLLLTGNLDKLKKDKIGLGLKATWVNKKVKGDPFEDNPETEEIEERQPLDSKHITIYNKENIEKTLMLMIKDLEEKKC